MSTCASKFSVKKLVYEEPVHWDYFYNEIIIVALWIDRIIIVALSTDRVSLNMCFKGVLCFFSHLAIEGEMINMFF